MYFRCKECRASIWVDGGETPAASSTLTCGDCGTSYTPKPLDRLGTTVAEHYRAVLVFASEHDIEMPGAYSVLLGLLTLEQALALRDRGHADRAGQTDDGTNTASDESSRPGPAPGRGALIDFDPAFQRAVDAGHMTVQQAMRRGDREVFVAGLVRRHGLPRQLAVRVADNRMSIREALSLKPAPEPAPSRRDVKPTSSAQLASVLAVACVMLSGASWYIWGLHFGTRAAPVVHPQAQASPASRSSPDVAETVVAVAPAVGKPSPIPIGTEVRRNDVGEVVEIIARDPASVLIAFCDLYDVGLPVQPVEVTETVPRLGDARLGVFRDPSVMQQRSAIWIRKDRRTRRWVAGDGKGMIPKRIAPELPPGAFRRPVETDRSSSWIDPAS